MNELRSVQLLTGVSPGPYAHKRCLDAAIKNWWATEGSPTPRSIGSCDSMPVGQWCCFCHGD